MKNPLDNLPFNTDQLYVVALTNSGCEVYVPLTVPEKYKVVDMDTDAFFAWCEEEKTMVQQYLTYGIS